MRFGQKAQRDKKNLVKAVAVLPALAPSLYDQIGTYNMFKNDTYFEPGINLRQVRKILTLDYTPRCSFLERSQADANRGHSKEDRAQC